MTKITAKAMKELASDVRDHADSIHGAKATEINRCNDQELYEVREALFYARNFLRAALYTLNLED